MTAGWALTEALVGLVLVFTACVVLTRPAHRTSRFLLGMAAASFVIGIIGVADGLNG